MNLAAPAIRRPIATILLTAAIAIAGIIAFQVLPVSPLPQIDSPTISVNASLPGASPDVMAAAVATPLERQFGHIAGVTEMTSQSSTGSTNVTLQFALDRDINAAAREVQAAISAARTYLPANLPSNPTYRKVNSADTPIVILGLTSTSQSKGALYDSASTILVQKLSQVQGVGQVTVGGSSLPAVRVEINPLQLEHYGLKLSDVASFLKSQNAHTPTGSVADGSTTSYITVNDQLAKAADYKPLIVSAKNGAVLRLQDIADVVDSTESLRSGGYVNGQDSVIVIVFKQPGSNIIQTVDRIKAQLPAMQAAIPASQKITLVLDQTTTIRASLRDVERTLIISILLVIVVVFVFLRDWRATIIPGIAVPVSLTGTFAAMYLLGYSLDNLSLMALTISTGFVIDDAIVVMENIKRYLEQGLRPMDAAFKGAKEIGFTVLSITLSLIAVFIPILLMGGIVGRLFREFAVTLSIAILISMVLSLTTTPMLCSLLLKPETRTGHGRLYRFSETVFERLAAGYERSLRWILRDHPYLVLLLFLFTMGLNVVYLVRVPKGFFPQQDTGVIVGGLQGTQDASFAKMDDALKRIVAIVRADPAVQNVVGFTGGQGSSNSGFVFISLKPLDERKASATDIVNRLRPKLMVVKEAQTFMFAAQDLRVGGRQSNAQYQYSLQADTNDDLKKYVPKLAQQMKGLSTITDVNSDLQSGGLQAYLTYDRSTAARLGITPADIDSVLNYSFSQAQASTIYKTLNQYHVILEAQPQLTTGPDAFKDTYIQTASGSVPLAVITSYRPRTGPLAVNHSGLYPSSTISFNLAPGASLGAATAEIHALEDRLQIPKSVHGTFAGTAQQYQASLDSEPLLIATAIFAVYVLLGILYESFIHPITILTTLPSASLGAVITLILFDSDLNVISLIGIILLIGIVKKNAIMMIDFALQMEREHDMGTEEAIFQACVLRFRPILMTTAAAFFGAVPLAFGSGIGSELRRPLGLTILGGLVVSQILTLYSTPVVYLMLDRLRKRVVEKGRAGALGVLAVLALTGCNVGPTYERPAMPAKPVGAYKENTAGSADSRAGGWRPANPSDAMIRGKWWEIFGDPELNALEERLNIDNQNIKQFFENYMAARALVRNAKAALYPQLGTAPGASARGTQAGTTPTYAVPLTVSWEPDLFGKIRNGIRQQANAAQVSAANLANERLSEQVSLADYYFQIRGQDALLVLYDETLVNYRESLRLAQVLSRTGIDSEQAVAQAEVTLHTAEANATAVATTRAQYEHAMALLLGESASSFAMKPAPLEVKVPYVPIGVPSQVLERRPDIAAAERTMAEANALIGVGKAAYYPDISLSAGVGAQSTALGTLFDASSLFWSLGGTATEAILDFGARSATVQQYEAQYRAAVAAYRQTVLNAFKEVEDQLVAGRQLAEQTQRQEQAVTAATRYEALAKTRYTTGIDTYLNLITAETSLLGSRQSMVSLQTTQMTSAVQLIAALGGGWDATQLPSEKDVGRKP